MSLFSAIKTIFLNQVFAIRERKYYYFRGYGNLVYVRLTRRPLGTPLHTILHRYQSQILLCVTRKALHIIIYRFVGDDATVL